MLAPLSAVKVASIPASIKASIAFCVGVGVREIVLSLKVTKPFGSTSRVAAPSKVTPLDVAPAFKLRVILPLEAPNPL